MKIAYVYKNGRRLLIVKLGEWNLVYWGLYIVDYARCLRVRGKHNAYGPPPEEVGISLVFQKEKYTD